MDCSVRCPSTSRRALFSTPNSPRPPSWGTSSASTTARRLCSPWPRPCRSASPRRGAGDCPTARRAETRAMACRATPCTLNRVEIQSPDGREHTPHAQEIVPHLPPGTTSVHYGAGGGGFGSPWERDIEAVVADVRNGFVSATAAAEVYGVVLSADGWGPDGPATGPPRR